MGIANRMSPLGYKQTSSRPNLRSALPGHLNWSMQHRR